MKSLRFTNQCGSLCWILHQFYSQPPWLSFLSSFYYWCKHSAHSQQLSALRFPNVDRKAFWNHCQIPQNLGCPPTKPLSWNHFTDRAQLSPWEGIILCKETDASCKLSLWLCFLHKISFLRSSFLMGKLFSLSPLGFSGTRSTSFCFSAHAVLLMI